MWRGLAVGAFFVPLSLFAATPPSKVLPAPIARALKQADIPEQSVGLWVQEVTADAPILYYHADRSFNPASTIKLVTTYAGLELLGPAYTWRTNAYYTGRLEGDVLHGDLILKGFGDPKLTLESFLQLLRELRQRGIREIRGDLMLDRSFFPAPAHAPGDFDGRATRPYNVGPDPLLVNFKAIRITLIPESQTQSVKIIADPKPPQVELVNQLTLDSADCGEWRERLGEEAEDRGGHAVVVFRGAYSVECGEQSYRLSVLRSPEYAYGIFRQLWEELGGSFRGGLREGTVPLDAVLLAQRESSSLAEAVRDINKFSNNVMARQLYLTLGAESGLGTQDSAFARLKLWLKQKELVFPELVMDNGSGLSRASRISVAHLGALLIAAYRSPIMPEFISSLPLVALDGTMKNRLNALPVAGKAHIKTGSLEGARAIAGYVLDHNGRRLAVVFMVNHPRAANARLVEDAILRWVYERQ